MPGTFSVSGYSSVRNSLSVSVLCRESAALGASLGVGPAPKVVCRSKSATPPSSPFLLGTASPWSNLAAIPPGLVSLRLDGSDSQSLPGVQDTAVPAVGADSVSHRRSVRQHSSPPRIRAASHRLRGCSRFSVVALCFYSTVSACSRIPSYPASASVRAHSLGPFRPRPRRPSAHPFCCLSLPGSGSLKSPSPCAVKASQPSRTRPPPGPSLRSLRSLRLLGHWQTHCRHPQSHAPSCRQ